EHHDGLKVLLVVHQRPRPRMKGLTDKFIGNKEQHHTKPDIRYLLEDEPALSDKHAAVLPEMVRSLRRMPGLLAIDHIKKIIVPGPKVRKLRLHHPGLHRAGKRRDQRVAALELPVVLGILQDAVEEIVHSPLNL